MIADNPRWIASTSSSCLTNCNAALSGGPGAWAQIVNFMAEDD
jgi:hypothetical protein